MIQKKHIKALGLTCLIAAMTLAPAAEGLAAAWEKSGGVYVSSDGTTIAGVVVPKENVRGARLHGLPLGRFGLYPSDFAAHQGV